MSYVEPEQFVAACKRRLKFHPLKHIELDREPETEPRPRFHTWEDEYADQVCVPARGPL